MLEIKRLVREIHRRSLWQVLSIYLAGSWVAVQVVDTLVDNAGLPAWMPGMAIALLVIGFPVVMATAFIQEGVGHGEVDRDTTSGSAAGSATRPAGDPRGQGLSDGGSSGLGLFTWRTHYWVVSVPSPFSGWSPPLL